MREMAQKTNAPSRAEKIRERRQKGNQNPKRNKRGKHPHLLAGSTPVMVRKSARSEVKSKKRNKRIKRRYDISLPPPGTEMRLPSIPSMRIGWRLLSFIILIGLSYALYILWNSPAFLVQEVLVEGTDQYTPDHITRSLLVYQKPIFLVEPEKVAQQLTDQIPGLLSASVRVEFPATVAILVEERVPVILWEQGDTNLWVDSRGIAFDPPGLALGLVHVLASTNPPTPFPSGMDDSDDTEMTSTAELVHTAKAFMTPEMVTAILSLGKHVPNGAMLLYNGDHGFGWRDPGGWDVYFGLSDNDMAMKLKVYTSVIQKLQAEGIQPAIVSVEFLHAPFYRTER